MLLPDVVTMDIVMPVQDGIETVRALRSFDPEARVIMVSAMGESLIAEAMEAGALAYVLKPFNPDRFSLSCGW